jgi:hypothetical protein
MPSIATAKPVKVYPRGTDLVTGLKRLARHQERSVSQTAERILREGVRRALAVLDQHADLEAID